MIIQTEFLTDWKTKFANKNRRNEQQEIRAASLSCCFSSFIVHYFIEIEHPWGCQKQLCPLPAIMETPCFNTLGQRKKKGIVNKYLFLTSKSFWDIVQSGVKQLVRSVFVRSNNKSSDLLPTQLLFDICIYIYILLSRSKVLEHPHFSVFPEIQVVQVQ